jgi:hypothetical protein
MPRGRHRTSLQLRRLLPPLTAVAVASACAGGALASDDPAVLRAIVAVAAAAVCTGAVMQRRREWTPEKEVSRLQTARIRDEWRTDEKIAELESDLDEYREIRTSAERKLNAKRTELARLRGEHAALLKRYATAESERARALENTRLALAPGPQRSPLTPSAYLKANAALDALEHNAARQDELEAAAEAEKARKAAEEAEAAEAAKAAEAAEAARRAAAEQHSRSAVGASALQPVRQRGRVPAAAAVAVVPPSAQRGRRSPAPEPGFDFFGTQRALTAPRKPAELTSGEDLADEDLADVVGEEIAAAEAAGAAEAVEADDTIAEAEAEDGEFDGEDEDAAVIDLTEHDETEAIDVRGLRALS